METIKPAQVYTLVHPLVSGPQKLEFTKDEGVVSYAIDKMFVRKNGETLTDLVVADPINFPGFYTPKTDTLGAALVVDTRHNSEHHLVCSGPVDSSELVILYRPIYASARSEIYSTSLTLQPGEGKINLPEKVDHITHISRISVGDTALIPVTPDDSCVLHYRDSTGDCLIPVLSVNTKHNGYFLTSSSPLTIFVEFCYIPFCDSKRPLCYDVEVCPGFDTPLQLPTREGYRTIIDHVYSKLTDGIAGLSFEWLDPEDYSVLVSPGRKVAVNVDTLKYSSTLSEPGTIIVAYHYEPIAKQQLASDIADSAGDENYALAGENVGVLRESNLVKVNNYPHDHLVVPMPTIRSLVDKLSNLQDVSQFSDELCMLLDLCSQEVNTDEVDQKVSDEEGYDVDDSFDCSVWSNPNANNLLKIAFIASQVKN